MSWIECETSADIEIAYTNLNGTDYSLDKSITNWCYGVDKSGFYDVLNRKVYKLFYAEDDKGVPIASLFLKFIEDWGSIGQWIVLGGNIDRDKLTWEEADNLSFPFYKKFIEENGEIVFTTDFVESAGLFLDVDGKVTPDPSELPERMESLYGLRITTRFNEGGQRFDTIRLLE